MRAIRPRRQFQYACNVPSFDQDKVNRLRTRLAPDPADAPHHRCVIDQCECVYLVECVNRRMTEHLGYYVMRLKRIRISFLYRQHPIHHGLRIKP